MAALAASGRVRKMTSRQFNRISKAISDAKRYRMLARIAAHRGEVSCGEVRSGLGTIEARRDVMAALEGKVAVVTGASKGIGAGIAGRFGVEGAKVVVNYASDRAGAEKVVAKIKQAGGEAIAVQGDVAKKQDVEHIFAEAKKAFGKLNILVSALASTRSSRWTKSMSSTSAVSSTPTCSACSTPPRLR